jgi:hypothetical protein
MSRINMAAFRNISTKSLDIHALKRICVILGCLLFLISFISPFYHIKVFYLAGASSTYYWSYEFENHYSFFNQSGLNQQWFSDYWFTPYLSVRFGITWILLPLFTIQVLTLLFSVVSIILSRRVLLLAPVLLSISAMALMVGTSMMPSEYPVSYSGEYQLGFYLVFLSLVPFLSAFVLGGMTKKMQTEPTVDSRQLDKM